MGVKAEDERYARRDARLRRMAPPVLVLALVAVALLAAGCAGGQPDIWRPSGSAGHEIKTLGIQMFAILAGVLVAVWAILTYVIIRYRKRPESAASKTRGNLTLEIVWTLIPAVIVTVLFILTVRTTQQIMLPDRGRSSRPSGTSGGGSSTSPTRTSRPPTRSTSPSAARPRSTWSPPT